MIAEPASIAFAGDPESGCLISGCSSGFGKAQTRLQYEISLFDQTPQLETLQ